MKKSYQSTLQGLSRKLTLDDLGLTYEVGTGHYNLHWEGFDHRIERIGRSGVVGTVILVTRDGKWCGLTGFENMAEIAVTLRQHVPTSGPQGLFERTLFHPWFGAACAVLAFFGLLLMTEMPRWGVPTTLVLMAGGIIGFSYATRRSPTLQLIRAEKQKESGSALHRFFVNLAVWIAIVLITLFVLNVVVPRFR